VSSYVLDYQKNKTLADILFILIWKTQEIEKLKQLIEFTFLSFPPWFKAALELYVENLIFNRKKNFTNFCCNK
jgi:hypothetical protein